VIVFTVVNHANNWQGSLRFLDAEGKPVRDVTLAWAP